MLFVSVGRLADWQTWQMDKYIYSVVCEVYCDVMMYECKDRGEWRSGARRRIKVGERIGMKTLVCWYVGMLVWSGDFFWLGIDVAHLYDYNIKNASADVNHPHPNHPSQFKKISRKNNFEKLKKVVDK